MKYEKVFIESNVKLEETIWMTIWDEIGVDAFLELIFH